jgi:high-affinity iron transporter
MFAQFLIAFREGLEGAILTAILIGYLQKTQRHSLTRAVWYGVVVAIAASFVLSFAIILLYGGLSGPMKPLFEGVAALIAVVVLSSMIYWMAIQGSSLQQHLEQRTELIVQQGTSFGLMTFAFVAVFREGVETVLFLTPYVVQDLLGTLLGSLFGLLSAILIALGFFVAGRKLNLRRFFYFTGILLVFLAGGLLGYGIHELVEFFTDIGVNLGWVAQPAFILPFPADHILHHKGLIGGILATLFGYTVNPEWIRVTSHMVYLIVTLPLVVKAYQKREESSS